ncbi:methyltransferase type 11 [Mycobacterium talmoniae]|uniref:Methyltransferase type 11 n=2 Tax=Mycobacterium talmoniae TaxID=1858794 RepID=A0A1S1NJY9_9MYCO|nr:MULTISPECIES: class I SAM-dependent methyltransferase [Mycobacterium]OHV03494.1 methyltransferase type 11 [Mycobacterium talmoniae]TDH56563.1 class I SAM-dependent methyltransferase [Mycobacterium eburneum]
MNDMAGETFDIDRMPRGGPDASWLDRLLETDRPEYLDRDDVDDLKRRVVRSLDRGGRILGHHEMFARLALAEVADVPDPNILELGSGHGGVARALVKLHPTAQVTATDIEPTSVAAIAAGDLGSHPRVTVREMDATAIDAPDGGYDLAVFAQSFHHLPPRQAVRVFAEGTRVAHKLLIIDLPRLSAPVHVVQLVCLLPFAVVFPVMHDGLISALRAYSPSALRALARYADPTITVEVRKSAFNIRGRPQLAVAYRETG